MKRMKKIILVSMAVFLALNIQGQVLPYNASLLNDLKTAYHQGDKAAVEAVGKFEAQARKIGLSKSNKKTLYVLYYQLIK